MLSKYKGISLYGARAQRYTAMLEKWWCAKKQLKITVIARGCSGIEL